MFPEWPGRRPLSLSAFLVNCLSSLRYNLVRLRLRCPVPLVFHVSPQKFSLFKRSLTDIALKSGGPIMNCYELSGSRGGRGVRNP
ncbi:uncharacterized protein F5147DRAFT_405527 [Suillus discolor]|uniref:Uncharacterized protein n=1 Tax=Suillus discolor TaxID=1912936 RepID=A0A9P7EWA7_9AGAM|nr:uncharacterized protein F5147DRAFT_405527 [Suillus discolor]KAG2094833.1 hypothetical protein F5147DRAFT_405527 [Suillus discolor]